MPGNSQLAPQRSWTDGYYTTDLKRGLFLVILPAMANPDHVALARRYAAGERDMRLEMLDLSGADLSGLDFSEAWLRDTDLSQANLQGCHFVGAPMPGTRLAGADLTGADLHGAIAAGAIFSQAILVEASLRAADLYGADLTHANFTRADLTQADLSLVQAMHAVFTGARLARAILFSANFSHTDLRDMVDTPAAEIVRFTAFTVTVCGVFQLAVVKVTLAGETVPSVVSLLLSPMVTLSVDGVSSTMVKLSVPPHSVVTSPEMGLTVMPGGPSSSTLVTLTSLGLRPL